MIKTEVVFDGNTIKVNGLEFEVVAEYSYDIEIVGLNDDYTCETIEDAVKFCMESSNV